MFKFTNFSVVPFFSLLITAFAIQSLYVTYDVFTSVHSFNTIKQLQCFDVDGVYKALDVINKVDLRLAQLAIPIVYIVTIALSLFYLLLRYSVYLDNFYGNLTTDRRKRVPFPSRWYHIDA